MTKIKTIIIATICILTVCVATFSACVISPVRYAEKLSYVEWRDDNGVLKFRAAKSGLSGCGTIVLNGEEIPASFSIGGHTPTFRVYINNAVAKKLGYEVEYRNYAGLAFDDFALAYSEKDEMIYSCNGEVSLFGMDIGKICLKAYPVDKTEFEIWEIISTWVDNDKKLKIDNIGINYFLYKCWRAKTELSDGKTKDLTFRWLSDVSEFRIYEEFQVEDYKTITDETPYLAAGSFEYDYDTCKITLNFTEDELLGLQGQSLELSEVS